MDRSAKARAKKQTRLSFAPRGSSSPSLAASSPGTQDRLASVRYVHPFKKNQGRSLKDGGASLGTRDGMLGGGLPTPENSSQINQDKDKDTKNEGNIEAELPTQSSPCPAPTKPLPAEIDISSDDGEVIRSQQPSRKRARKDVSGDDSSADPITPLKKKSKLRSGQAGVQRDFSVEIVTPRPKRPSAKVLRQARDKSPSKSQIGSSSRGGQASTDSKPQILSDSDDDDDEEDLVVNPSTARSRRLAQRIQPMIELDDSDSEDIVTSSPVKRRRLNVEDRVPQTPRKHSEQDQLDLAEDLEDIQDSVVTKTRTRGRLAHSAKDKRRKQLEILRRRRAGEKPSEDLSPSGDEDENSTSNSEDDDNDNDEEGEDENHEPEPLGYQYISSDRDEDSDGEAELPPNEDLDRYEDDFVIQDDEQKLGVPTGLEDMPLEFTRHRYKQPREYFRDVVEWMVHNKLNPDFNREDNMYRLAFMKLNDETMGRVGSQYISSAWNAGFKRALEARPEIEVTRLPVIAMTNGCDACNKTDHKATFEVQFRGDPYYLETLDPVTDDEEDSEDSADRGEGFGNRDRKGNKIPDSSVCFNVGRFCKSKANMAHTLLHWRHNLNGWITDYLLREGITTKKNMKKRKKWSAERKAEYVDEVVGMMHEKGEIDSLWRDFHINLKAAREDREFRW